MCLELTTNVLNSGYNTVSPYFSPHVYTPFCHEKKQSAEEDQEKYGGIIGR